MVERMLSMHEAQGSIPCSSTFFVRVAVIAQLGERQTEDLKVPCSIHGHGTIFFLPVPCSLVG
jgi:hypothetical protein